jgi:ribosomal protein S6--L-glutamate ligase
METSGSNKSGQEMQNFNEYFTEKFEEPIEQQDLHVVVLGKGGEEGTFADLAEKVSKKKNIKFNIVHVDEAWISQKDVEIGKVTIQNADGEDTPVEIEIYNSIVFVRAGAIQTLAAQAIVSSLQVIGFFLVNDLEAMLACDNKMSNVIMLERNNIPSPKSSILSNKKSIEDAHERIGGKFPVVIKTLTGTQGVGVSIVNDMASLVSVADSLWKFDAQILIQEYFNIESDIRTLVLGGKIIGSAERIRKNPNDFRNNVHLGADTKPYKLSQEEMDVITSSARSSGTLYCGVDHCMYKGKPYILEVNGSPGIRSHFYGYDLQTQKGIGKQSAEQMISSIIDFFSSDLNRRQLMRSEAGYIETIILKGLEDDPIRAKFDTGNSAIATMLHVDTLEADGDFVKWTKNGKSFRSEVIDISEPSRGLVDFDKRPIVEHEIRFNNKTYTAELGLTTKDTASEMLVNRKLMTQFKVAINPNRRFILSEVTEKNDDNDH